MHLFRAVFMAAIMVLGATAPGRGQAAIPYVWDARQRLPKPELSDLPRLRFLTTTDFFPFNFLDADGRLTGFHVDLARAICRVLEIEDRCQIQALPFEELDAALVLGQGEALIAGIAISRKTREKFLFSRPYLQFPARFLARRDADLADPFQGRIAGKRIGVLADTAHEHMLADFFGQARAVPYPDQTQLLADLKEGQIDLAFGDGMRLGFWIANGEAEGCCAFAGGPYLAPEYLGHGLAIATGSDQGTLVAALNYALQEIEEQGTFAELYLRYFPVGFY